MMPESEQKPFYEKRHDDFWKGQLNEQVKGLTLAVEKLEAKHELMLSGLVLRIEAIERTLAQAKGMERVVMFFAGAFVTWLVGNLDGLRLK